MSGLRTPSDKSRSLRAEANVNCSPVVHTVALLHHLTATSLGHCVLRQTRILRFASNVNYQRQFVRGTRMSLFMFLVKDITQIFTNAFFVFIS